MTFWKLISGSVRSRLMKIELKNNRIIFFYHKENNDLIFYVKTWTIFLINIAAFK